mgnify:CR=1 FL=1
MSTLPSPRWLVLLLGAALALAGAEPPARTPLGASVRMLQGRPTIHLDDQPVAPVLYALTDVPGGRWSWEELPAHNLRQFARQGVRLFQVDLFFDHCWREDGTMDLAVARRQIAGVLAARPDAAVFIRFHVTAPKWWRLRHPEEGVRYADIEAREESVEGYPRIIEEDNTPVRRVSIASERWRREATDQLRAFLRGLAATPEGAALAGIHVANGVYGEWHNWGFFHHEPDVSEPMNRFWRGWLRERYDTEAALRTAWGEPAAAFATTVVPGLAERETTRGLFRDPARERRVVDYYTCVHQLVADTILHFARVAKESWPRPLIVGTFYGYYFSTFNRQAAGGHLELHRVLGSPHVDYLSGPQAYEPEALKAGDPYRSRSLLTSIRLHGKLWLDEMDAEPTIPLPQAANHDQVLRNGVATLRRNVLFSATKGMGLWYYDFGVSGFDLDNYRHNQRGSRGTWDHAVLLREVRALRELVEARLAQPYRSEADVLFVYDTHSFTGTASLRREDPFSTVMIDHHTLAAFRSGVVFDPVHLADLGRVDLAPYRAVVFGNVYRLSEAQRRDLRERVAADGRTLVWYYAPGYSDGTSLDPARIGALTGLSVEPCSVSGAPAVEFTPPGAEGVRYTTGKATVAPLFAVNDPAAEILGRYAGTGRGAIARRAFPTHTAWYVAVPHTTVQPLQHILIAAGAHRYVESGAFAYAGGGLLVVHTHKPEGGAQAVRLRSGRTVTFDLPPGYHTLVLDPATGEPLRPVVPEIFTR